MTGQKFNGFLTQARLSLDQNEHVIFIYDGAPAHKRGTLGFSVLRFWLFFRSVLRFFCQKTSVLVFIAVCGFFVFQHLFFAFRRSYLRFFGFVMRCGFWVFLFCPISGFRLCTSFYAVLRFWVIFSSVLRFLIYPNAPASHNNPAIPDPNPELKKLPPYSSFLNILEQAMSALKAAIKAYISLPER